MYYGTSELVNQIAEDQVSVFLIGRFESTNPDHQNLQFWSVNFKVQYQATNLKFTVVTYVSGWAIYSAHQWQGQHFQLLVKHKSFIRPGKLDLLIRISHLLDLRAGRQSLFIIHY